MTSRPVTSFMGVDSASASVSDVTMTVAASVEKFRRSLESVQETIEHAASADASRALRTIMLEGPVLWNHDFLKTQAQIDCVHKEDARSPLPFDGSPADPDEWSCADCGLVEKKHATITRPTLSVPTFRDDIFSLREALQHRGQGLAASYTAAVDWEMASGQMTTLTAFVAEGILVEDIVRVMYVLDDVATLNVRAKRVEMRLHPKVKYLLARWSASQFLTAMRYSNAQTQFAGHDLVTDSDLQDNEIQAVCL